MDGIESFFVCYGFGIAAMTMIATNKKNMIIHRPFSIQKDSHFKMVMRKQKLI